MPEDKVTCPNCGNTFPVGVPRGKRINRYGGRHGVFVGLNHWEIDFSCPECGRWMGATLEEYEEE